MRVAILFPGRIRGWQYCKESLKRLQDKYNATFFVSLNQQLPDESSNVFCDFFHLIPEQIAYIPTQTPEHYRQYHSDGREHNYYSQWFHIKSAFDLCKNYCLKDSVVFDVVIKYRADIDTEMTLSIPNPIEPNRFYCPAHLSYQTDDQIAFGDFQTMEKYSQLVNFYEYFYQNGMLMYGANRQDVKPTEILLFDYLCILAQKTDINIIYFEFKWELHIKKNSDEPFTLNPSLN